MNSPARNRRRWWGVVFLGLAMAMLIAGETLLKPHLQGVGLLCYWLGCLLCVTIAAGVAIVDALRTQRELRAEQRELLERTLQAVEQERQQREQQRR